MPEDGIRADGKLIRRLREGRGWTQEELARRIGCAKRTVENVEAGKPILTRTLHELAQTLDKPPESLRLSDGAQSSADDEETLDPSEKAPRAGSDDSEWGGNIIVTTAVETVDIVINRDFNSFTEEEQEKVLRLIRQALALSGEIRVLSKRPGSVVLTLELSPEEAERLFWAVKSGELAGLGVVDARRVEGDMILAPIPTPGPDDKTLLHEERSSPGARAETNTLGQGVKFKLLVVRGEPRGKCLLFPPGEFVIGRGSECHIRPNSESISRQHCVLRVTRAGAVIRDLDSDNGTFVNGSRIVGERLLADGDKLQLGQLVFEIRMTRKAVG